MKKADVTALSLGRLHELRSAMEELDVMLMDATKLQHSIQININRICLALREKTSHICCPHYASSSSCWTFD
ncbi:hypothetical protein GBF38_009272 [Nibea albiflora]|uniref:Uncharacterized protein n=1 Tax=Nibea albiflora TaxID=240163 RepID=A0ACB7EQ39_NIBAL|nr:hypothetical protein GBF38_009272 [Nibea albiflora]